MFEDIPAGIMAGKSAGITTFAMEDDFSAKDRHEKMKLADYYIEDFMQVYEHIKF